VKTTIETLRKLIREAFEQADAYAKTEYPQDYHDIRKTKKVDKPDSIGSGKETSMRTNTPVEQKTKLVAKELQKLGKPIKQDLLKFMKTFNEDDLVVNNASWFANEFVKKQAN
jgi:hypothetical protein